MPFVSLFREVRSAAQSLAKQARERAYASAPSNVKETVERLRRRYENGRVDAQRALEELAELEERALRMAFQLLLFPVATAGAIRELYSKVRDLEGAQDREIDMSAAPVY